MLFKAKVFTSKLKPFLFGLLATLLIVACQNNAVRQPTNSQPADCRTVQHAFGETCIPTNPQRIVVTNQIAFEVVLALDLKPIAAAEPNLVGSRFRHLARKADNVVSIGKENQLSLEKILQLNPDLILGSSYNLEKNYKQFSQIAPTVALDFYSHDAWKATLERVGEILNRSQQVQQQLENYQKQVEKLQAAMGEQLDKIKVSVVRFYADERIEFRDSFSFPGSVLEDVGLPRPDVQYKTNSDSTSQKVSTERLDLLDGDAIFVAIDAGAKESFSKFSQDPLWQKLEAVQGDRVFTVDSGYWIFGNVLAANAILDDLEKYLVDSTSVPPTPRNSA